MGFDIMFSSRVVKKKIKRISSMQCSRCIRCIRCIDDSFLDVFVFSLLVAAFRDPSSCLLAKYLREYILKSEGLQLTLFTTSRYIPILSMVLRSMQSLYKGQHV
jgi:hypothetical protein